MLSAILLVAFFGITNADVSDWMNQETPLVTEYLWKSFDYEWESPQQKQTYIKNGWYDPHAIASIDVDRSSDGRTFLTTPRNKGVPAALHTISEKYSESGPLLIPYPSWSWYKNPQTCKGITEVYRIAIDRCNRLWVLDTGRMNFNRTCPAQLLAFDLNTDHLQVKVQIPDNLAQADFGKFGKFGLLVTPIVEVGSTCSDTTVYMADAGGGAVLVWDGAQIKRIESEVFKPDRRQSNITIAGDTFFNLDGVFGMALSPQTYHSDNQYLFFKALASRSIYAINTKNLKEDHAKNTTIKAIEGFNYLPSQATVMAFSSQGVLFYGLTREIGIGCWNIRKQFIPQNFKTIITDEERLQFVSGIKVISPPYLYPSQEEYLLITSNRLQKQFIGKRNIGEINFRVMRIPVNDIIQNTECDNYTK